MIGRTPSELAQKRRLAALIEKLVEEMGDVTYDQILAASITGNRRCSEAIHPGGIGRADAGQIALASFCVGVLHGQGLWETASKPQDEIDPGERFGVPGRDETLDHELPF